MPPYGPAESLCPRQTCAGPSLPEPTSSHPPHSPILCATTYGSVCAPASGHTWVTSSACPPRGHAWARLFPPVVWDPVQPQVMSPLGSGWSRCRGIGAAPCAPGSAHISPRCVAPVIAATAGLSPSVQRLWRWIQRLSARAPLHTGWCPLPPPEPHGDSHAVPSCTEASAVGLPLPDLSSKASLRPSHHPAGWPENRSLSHPGVGVPNTVSCPVAHTGVRVPGLTVGREPGQSRKDAVTRSTRHDAALFSFG